MPVRIGERAPDFRLLDSGKKMRTLDEFRGKKTVVAFFPGAFTGVCTKEMCTFRDSLSRFHELDAQIIAISVDPPATNKAFAEQNKLGFPLLSDHTRYVSSQWTGLHIDFSGVPGLTAAKRSVFVLDREGIVRYAAISDNPAAEPDYREIQDTLASI